MIKAVKFGGSSLAGPVQFRRVKAIIKEDPARKYIVVSAPGQRGRRDIKVTDLLGALYDRRIAGQSTAELQIQLRSRYEEILSGLGMEDPVDLRAQIEELRWGPDRGRAYTVSRGEYLNARILSCYLELPFVDAADVICFDETGRFLPEETDQKLKSRLSGLPGAVIPGFYGAGPDGTICTFPRGGSDITGALVARAVFADLYENWTDVSGFLAADPRIVEDPISIGVITYQELHDLACMGACVFHEDAVEPVRELGIPINIRNTNQPEDVGTYIIRDTEQQTLCGMIGITGKKGFCALHIQTLVPDPELAGTVRKILNKYGLPCDWISCGPDNLSAFLLLPQQSFLAHEEEIFMDIWGELRAESVSLEPDLALVAIGGRGDRARHLIPGMVCTSLNDAGIPVRGIFKGMGSLTFVACVSDLEFEAAVRTIYHRLIRNAPVQLFC